MRVTTDNLGAWLLKANGDRSDVAERAARRERITDRCVRRSYRTDLMRAGQQVLLWVSGSRRVTAGIWALGELTGAAEADDDPTSRVLRVPVTLRWLDEADRVARTELKADPRLADLEVLRQPQAANPSFLTVTQLDTLREYLRRPV